VFVSYCEKEKKQEFGCAIFRVYRPKNVKITPHDDLPTVYNCPRPKRPRNAQEVWEVIVSYSSVRLPTTSIKQALLAGERIEGSFSQMISKYLKPIPSHAIGTHFFHPSHTAGLLVNANATYVISFIPENRKGCRYTAVLPEYNEMRPYYGCMVVDHRTTKTIASLSVEDLGGWGATYTLFTATSEEAAVDGGYESSDNTHKLMIYSADEQEEQSSSLSSSSSAGPFGVVIRYLHIHEKSIDMPFEESSSVEPEEMKAEVKKSLSIVREERNAMRERCDGINNQSVHCVKGIGDVSFFGSRGVSGVKEKKRSITLLARIQK
jgi:hypothetical protein